MILRLVFSLLSVILFAVSAQQEAPSAPPPRDADDKPVEWVCPMDRDVRAKGPGKCPKCGMALVAGIPEQSEFKLKISTVPKAVKPGSKTAMTFEILDPAGKKRVAELEIVHERIFHLFLVSQDLKHFAHEHPTKDKGGLFHFDWTFPQVGMYRVLADFYPSGATPQLIAGTLFAGMPDASALSGRPARLEPDLKPQKAENTTVSLTMDPPQPLAGFKTLMFFDLGPADGLEKYLGAWGHMMAASSDLVDMIHNHPFLADGGPRVQFNMIFPRPGIYRVWVQFQRKGVVNTVAFNVPVEELK